MQTTVPEAISPTAVSAVAPTSPSSSPPAAADADAVARAVGLKEEGNALFKAGDWGSAVAMSVSKSPLPALPTNPT